MRFFYLSILSFLALILIGSNYAIAKTRSCSAWYEVNVTSVNGTVPAPHIRETKRVGNFSGRGKCSFPNDCRRRARDFCHSCMKDHWQSKGSSPTSCTYYSGGVGVQGYRIGNLRKTLDAQACRDLENAKIRYDVYRVTNGNKGCGSHSNKTMRRHLGYLTTRCR